MNLVDRTFGFETAVLSATDVITSAHNEANGVFNGLGLVKLMGRDSVYRCLCFISNDCCEFCLIPEVPFVLEGENGLLHALENRYSIGKTYGHGCC